MFPNPQSALPLPPRPSLERYKKLAKELVKACQSGNEEAIGDWADQWIRTLTKLAGWKNTRQVRAQLDRSINEVEDFALRTLSGKCALADGQFVIARSQGFESWPKFARHLEALAQKSSSVCRFEAAADAIVNGDAATLKRMLREDPKLIRTSSTREHGAQLLHYVSANGIEGYRQKTPKNIVAIAEMLLNAGAEIDASANVYGGGCTALGLAATSVHPERAGVQEALLRMLLDHGASLGQSSVIACLANGRPKAAEFLATRGAQLDLAGAAALGHLDTVKSFFEVTTEKQLNEGLLYACQYGRNSIVEFLLERDADLATESGDGQTALHRAVIGGHLHTVKLLLRHNPSLEVKNMFGGTVLSQALWSAAHGGDPDTYIAILEALVAAGAKIPECHVPVNARVDAWLAEHGSRTEPGWYWYSEKPRRKK